MRGPVSPPFCPPASHSHTLKELLRGAPAVPTLGFPQRLPRVGVVTVVVGEGRTVFPSLSVSQTPGSFCSRVGPWECFERQRLPSDTEAHRATGLTAVFQGRGTVPVASAQSPSLWPRCCSRCPALQAPCSTCPPPLPAGTIRKSWNGSSGSSSVTRTRRRGQR